MTIDERLQALTQTVELLAGMQIETEKRLQTNERLMTQVLESIARLAHTAEIHEQRLNDLEGR